MLHDDIPAPRCGFPALSRIPGGDSHESVTPPLHTFAIANHSPSATATREKTVNARGLQDISQDIARIIRAQRLRDMLQSIADWQRASGHDRHRARLAARHDIRAFRTHLALDRRTP